MTNDFQKTPQRPGAASAEHPQRPSAKNEEARKRYERQIDALAGTINRFRIDTQRFFAGDLKLPPEELRDEIKAEFRELQNSKLATSVDNFRLSSLEAQFNSHVELFGRRLREREEGARGRPMTDRPELRHDPTQGVLMGREGAVEALYKGLYQRKKGSKPAMDLERFRGHLQKQADAIRVKTGCHDIQFRIAEENGKMKIKARPIKKTGA